MKLKQKSENKTKINEKKSDSNNSKIKETIKRSGSGSVSK